MTAYRPVSLPLFFRVRMIRSSRLINAFLEVLAYFTVSLCFVLNC